jgi:hypothetical protein
MDFVRRLLRASFIWLDEAIAPVQLLRLRRAGRARDLTNLRSRCNFQ